jgi:hypothetical protein
VPESPSFLTSLPPELRNHIYSWLFIRDGQSSTPVRVSNYSKVHDFIEYDSENDDGGGPTEEEIIQFGESPNRIGLYTKHTPYVRSSLSRICRHTLSLEHVSDLRESTQTQHGHGPNFRCSHILAHTWISIEPSDESHGGPQPFMPGIMMMLSTRRAA